MAIMNSKFLLRGSALILTAAVVFSGCQQAAPPKSPDEMVKDGMKNLATVTSHQFEVAVNANILPPPGKKGTVKFDVTFGGGIDIKDQKDPKINLKLDGTGKIEDKSAIAGAELRMNKDNLYFSLSKLELSAGQELPPAIVGYIGKWFSIPIPPGSLDQLTANIPTGMDSQQVLTPEQQKMKALFENTQFFKNIKFVGVEDVKGEQSYHYTADVDQAALEKVVLSAADENGQAASAEEKQQLHDALSKLNFVGNVWIGKTSGVLNQVAGVITLPPSANDPMGTIAIRVSIWDFNKPVKVMVPEKSTEFPLEGLMGGLLGGGALGSGSSLNAGDDKTTLDSTSFAVPQ